MEIKSRPEEKEMHKLVHRKVVRLDKQRKSLAIDKYKR